MDVHDRLRPIVGEALVGCMRDRVHVCNTAIINMAAGTGNKSRLSRVNFEPCSTSVCGRDEIAKSGEEKMTKQRPKSRSDVGWRKRREIPDRQIVGAADQYAAACELLEPRRGVLLPQINAAAVSVELYLKSLSAERIYTADADMPEMSVVSTYPAKASHSLREQFGEISEEIRDQLIAAYNTKLRPELKDDLETALKKIDGAFSASRYPFEPGADVSKYSPPHLMRTPAGPEIVFPRSAGSSIDRALNFNRGGRPRSKE
jgi:hypothetical protein